MKKIQVIIFVTLLLIVSCRPEPTTIISSFRVNNISEHDVLIEIFKRDGELFNSTNIEVQSFYEKTFNHTTSCCQSCFLSGRDSVIIYFDDTVKMVHHVTDTSQPSNNIYKSLYFGKINDECLFEYFITKQDYLEALEGQ